MINANCDLDEKDPGIRWYRALPGTEVGNTLALARVNGIEVLLGRLIGGKAIAVSKLCPHRNLSMEGGALYTSEVACPNHRYTYDASTGGNRYPGNVFAAQKAKQIKAITVYPTREHDGWVWIALATS